MISQRIIENLACKHGATVVRHGDVCTQIMLPNDAVVSIAHNGGSYTSRRFEVGVCESALPCATVEVAYWHPNVRSVYFDYETETDRNGDLGDYLPNGDVHGWQNLADLKQIVETAAQLS